MLGPPDHPAAAPRRMQRSDAANQLGCMGPPMRCRLAFSGVRRRRRPPLLWLALCRARWCLLRRLVPLAQHLLRYPLAPLQHCLRPMPEHCQQPVKYVDPTSLSKCVCCMSVARPMEPLAPRHTTQLGSGYPVFNMPGSHCHLDVWGRLCAECFLTCLLQYMTDICFDRQPKRHNIGPSFCIVRHELIGLQCTGNHQTTHQRMQPRTLADQTATTRHAWCY